MVEPYRSKFLSSERKRQGELKRQNEYNNETEIGDNNTSLIIVISYLLSILFVSSRSEAKGSKNGDSIKIYVIGKQTSRLVESYEWLQ